MKPPLRHAALALILGCGLVLVFALHQMRPGAPLPASWTSTFQILGAPVKLADRAVTRTLPIGEVDERQLGEAYRATFGLQVNPQDADQRYLDAVFAEVVAFARKPFAYRAYLVPDTEPNAMALPGGVVLVTRGLLSTLGSESELAAVLAHELGHVERGHCFDAVRFSLLADKARMAPVGWIADQATAVLLRHAYSKTTEHEADEYAFELMRNGRYDPRGVSGAFRSLERWQDRARHGPREHPKLPNPIRDYAASHPPLAVRANEFGERADAWWHGQPETRRYVGKRNLADRIAASQRTLPEEYAVR